MYVLPPATQGIALCKAGDYEGGYALLAKLPDRCVAHDQLVDLYFYRAVSAHYMGDKLLVEADTEVLLFGWFTTEAPTRYKALASIMREDVKSWSAKPKDLDGISRKMLNISRRLAIAKGGPETQRQQKAVLRNLDEMIATQERQQQQKEEQEQAKNKKGDKPEGGKIVPSDGEAQPGPRGMPQSPASDSALPEGNGLGQVDLAKVQALSKVWGNLPPREQSRAMKELTKNMPAKYREAIQSYFRGIDAKTPTR